MKLGIDQFGEVLNDPRKGLSTFEWVELNQIDNRALVDVAGATGDPIVFLTGFNMGFELCKRFFLAQDSDDE